MTTEQAKSELMQIYGMLSEEKKQALDVLMAQNCDQCEVGNPCLYCEYEFKAKADRNEFYNWDAPIRHKADGEYISKSEAIRVASGYCHPSNIAKELEKLPSVDIPPDHDGCKDCVYQANPQDAMPCRECKHNYMDKWKAISSAESYKGMTNGEVVKAVFPDIPRTLEWHIQNVTDDEWWNSPYDPQEGAIRNDSTLFI